MSLKLLSDDIIEFNKFILVSDPKLHMISQIHISYCIYQLFIYFLLLLLSAGYIDGFKSSLRSAFYELSVKTTVDKDSQ